MDESQIASDVCLITDYEDLDIWARQQGLTNHPIVTNSHLDLFITKHLSDNYQQQDSCNAELLCGWVNDSTEGEHTLNIFDYQPFSIVMLY